MAEFKLPDVGEGLTEAELVAWKVKEGDVVAINDIICDIETAKSIVELPSPFAGTVQKLMVAEGETVPVGTPIIAIGDGARRPSPPSRPTRPRPRPWTSTCPTRPPAAAVRARAWSAATRPTAARSAVPARAPRRPPPRPVPTPSCRCRVPSPPAAPSRPRSTTPTSRPCPRPRRAPVTPADPDAVRALAKPPVRKLAKDLGVDLTAVTGSGDGGVITRADVEAAAGRSDAPLVEAGAGRARHATRARARPASRSRASAR